MITTRPGGTSNSFEMLKIKKSLLDSRPSNTNLTNKWINTSHNDKGNKSTISQRNHNNSSTARLSPMNKSVEVYAHKDHSTLSIPSDKSNKTNTIYSRGCATPTSQTKKDSDKVHSPTMISFNLSTSKPSLMQEFSHEQIENRTDQKKPYRCTSSTPFRHDRINILRHRQGWKLSLWGNIERVIESLETNKKWKKSTIWGCIGEDEQDLLQNSQNTEFIREQKGERSNVKVSVRQEKRSNQHRPERTSRGLSKKAHPLNNFII